MASPVSSCSTDFDASEVFAEALMEQINREDVRNMVQTQKDMLSRFEKTNEMLINFNILSANRCAATSLEFKKHTQLLYEMKRDLDTVFKRIRIIKERLGKVYPDAFKACGNVAPLLEEEEGEEESISSSQSSQSVTENKPSRVSQSEEHQQAEDQKPTSKQTASTNSSKSDKAQSSKPLKQSSSAGTVPKTSRPNSGKGRKTSLKSTKSNKSDDRS